MEKTVAEILDAFNDEKTSLRDMIKLCSNLDEEDLLNLSFRGVSFLHLATEYGNISLVNYILDKGADVNSIGNDYTGDKALHVSVRDGFVCMTRYLLERGANPNVVNVDEYTPLGLALNGLVNEKSVDYKKIILLLLDKGADPNQNDLMTNYAKDEGANPKILSLLEAYGGVINQGTKVSERTDTWLRNKDRYKFELVPEDLLDSLSDSGSDSGSDWGEEDEFFI